MSLPTNCTVCATSLSKRNRASVISGALGIHDLCADCYDFGGWENLHSDANHEESPDASCPVCNEELKMTKTPTVDVPVKDKTTRKPYFSHDNCTHDKTPKERAACRAKGEAAEYYGRDPKVPAPRKAKVKKTSIAIDGILDTIAQVDADDAAKVMVDDAAKQLDKAARKAAKRAAKEAEAKAADQPMVMWSSKGTGAITHWAILQDDETYVPACGNKLATYEVAPSSTVQGCSKCRAKGAPEAV